MRRRRAPSLVRLLSRSFRRTATIAAPLLLVAFGSTAARPAQTDLDTLALRIAELRAEREHLERQLEELLGSLTAAQRAELERRIAALDGDPYPPPPVAPRSPSPPASPRQDSAAPRVAPAIVAAAQAPGPADESRRCAYLQPLDSNGDGELTGGDRSWRHLYLWQDVDGDDAISAADEVESAFDLGVRKIRVDLRSYANRKEGSGDIDVRGTADLLVPRRRGRTLDRWTLVLDADGIAAADRILLTDSSGRSLSGLQPLRPELHWRSRPAGTEPESLESPTPAARTFFCQL